VVEFLGWDAVAGVAHVDFNGLRSVEPARSQ
jgi:hypothetical protein